MEVMNLFLKKGLWATLLCLGQTLIAQDLPPKYSPKPVLKPRQALKKAIPLFEQKNYESAYPYYKLAAEKFKKNKYLTYNLGICAMSVRDYGLAVESFEKLHDLEYDFPLARYYYAVGLKTQGKYPEAQQQFDLFLKENDTNPKDPFYKSATKQILACAMASNYIKSQEPFTVTNMGTGINSGADENCMAWSDSLNVFVYSFFSKDGQALRVKKREGSAPAPGQMGSGDYAASAPYIAPDGKTAFFTKQEKGSSGKPEFKIYTGTVGPNGSITDIKKLGAQINRDGFSSMHPCMAKTDRGQVLLYFSSSILGGEGGFDIWYSVQMLSGEFSMAYNAGAKINSPKDEIAPFYLNKYNTLFFSSNRDEGLGGFDVYRAVGNKFQWNMPMRFGAPINSCSDDYFFRVKGGGTSYLSSNRSGAKFDSYEHCCDDLYEVKDERK